MTAPICQAYLYGEASPQLDATNVLVVTEGVFTRTSRLTTPTLLVDALATWAADLTANLPSTYTVALTAAGRVQVSSDGPVFNLTLPGNVHRVLGFTAQHYVGATSYLGEVGPAAWVELVAWGADLPEDPAHVDLQQLRHQRAMAVGWGSVLLFPCLLVFRAADVATVLPQRASDGVGYLLGGRVRVGHPGGSAWTPINPSGYVDGWVVQTSDLETWGDDEDYVQLRATIARAP